MEIVSSSQIGFRRRPRLLLIVQRSQLFPDAEESAFQKPQFTTRFIDMEWDTPTGDARACGGGRNDARRSLRSRRRFLELYRGRRRARPLFSNAGKTMENLAT